MSPICQVTERNEPMATFRSLWFQLLIVLCFHVGGASFAQETRTLGVRGVSHITFTPDGKRLITCGRGNGDDVGGAVLWNVDDGKQILTYPTSHDFAKHAEIFNGGKEVCITSRFQMLQFFEVETGKRTKELDVQPQPKYPRHETLTISRDGKRLAFAQTTSELAVWDIVASKQLVRKVVQIGHFAKIQFSPDGELIASIDGQREGRLVLWTTTNLQPRVLLEGTVVSGYKSNSDNWLGELGSENGVFSLARA